MRIVLLTIISISLIVTACRKDFQGSVKDVAPPKTFLVVDTIIRYGAHRLTAQVTLNWYGTDANGYIKGYEWSIDKTVWHYTRHNDSTFIFNTPYGSDTGNIRFYVRAIDNLEQRDPHPAHVTIPIINSPPTIAFQSGSTNPTRTLPVVRFYFNAYDLDGAANLNRIELTLNDSAARPYKINPAATSIMLEAINMQAAVSTPCHLYLNNNTFIDTGILQGMLLNANNTLYIRVVDNAGIKSKWVSSYSLYIKKPQSGVAFINGYGYTGIMPSDIMATQQFYLSHISSQLTQNPDTIQIYERNAVTGYTQLAPDLFTQSKIFAIYKTIIWAAGDASQSLSLGERTLTTFFNNGGKLLFSGYVSSSFETNASFLDFTPASSLYVPKDTNLNLTDTSHLNPFASGYPVLQSNQNLSIVRPFLLNYGATPLYSANVLARKISTGSLFPETSPYPVIGKKADGSGNTNFILSMFELQTLDANHNMSTFFKQVLHTEFGL